MTVGQFQILDESGDTKVLWDSLKDGEVEAARNTFDKLKEKGYIAYQVNKDDGSKGVLLHDFDPDIERMILTPPLAGG